MSLKRGACTSGPSEEEEGEDGGCKRPKLEDSTDGQQDSESDNSEEEEEEAQLQDPGKKVYQEMKLVLKQLCSLVSREDCKDMLERIVKLVEKLASLVSYSSASGETPNPVKLLQVHLKQALFNSQAIKDEDNIKSFLNGLEDCSAPKSDRSDTIYVFLADYATELWYQWDAEEQQWQWSPEADGSIWMLCATTVVSEGRWKGEVPAPENVAIIKYLNTIRPTPTDEQYLPTFCDVLKLFQQLLGLGEGEVTSAVKRITTILLSCEVVGREGEAVRELRERLRELVREEGEREEGEREEEGEGGDRSGEGAEGGVERVGEGEGERGEVMEKEGETRQEGEEEREGEEG